MIAQLPFAGFNDTIWSQILDREHEQSVEYQPQRDEEDDTLSTDERLTDEDAGDIGEAFNDAADYDKMYELFVKDYVDAFAYWLNDRLDLKGRHRIKLKFMGYYRPNLHITHRIHVNIAPRAVRYLMALSACEGHDALRGIIDDTALDHSTLLSKPLAEWDPNELCMLITAALGYQEREHGAELYDYVIEGFQAWESAIDWPKLEASLQKLRDAKLEAKKLDDPDYVPPTPRCALTPDLFVDRELVLGL